MGWEQYFSLQNEGILWPEVSAQVLRIGKAMYLSPDISTIAPKKKSMPEGKFQVL